MIYPSLDRTGPTPIHSQIRAWIEEQITLGVWPPRFKLKAEVDLAQDLQVSRGTLRKSIGELIADGMLMQIHGRGTFVAPRVMEQPLAERLVTFSEDLIGKGIAYETQVLEGAVVSARGKMAAKLNLAPSEQMFYLKRVRLVGGEPVIVLHNYVVQATCPGIENFNFITKRLFEVLEESYQLRLMRGERTFQAQAANAEVATLLNMAEGEPVMHVEQLTYLDNGDVIECSELWLRGDCFRLVAAVNRVGKGNIGLAMAVATDTTPGVHGAKE